jgi:broad specificity phosphatase PhoE
VILIRHAAVAIDSKVPATRWQLSAIGKEQAAAVGARIAEYKPSIVIASEAPKASETGAIIAKTLGVRCETRAGLLEHDRSNEPFSSEEEWHAKLRQFFAEPDALVYGTETATAARERFAAAVAACPADAAVVAHGTVITLFVAQHNPIEPFAFWEGFVPAAWVLLAAGFRCDPTSEACIQLG